MKIITLAFLAVIALFLAMIYQEKLRTKGEHILEVKEEPGVFIKYKDHQHKITEDGTLYLIKATSEGVLIIEPATLDDCRRVLEENGQG